MHLGVNIGRREHRPPASPSLIAPRQPTQDLRAGPGSRRWENRFSAGIRGFRSSRVMHGATSAALRVHWLGFLMRSNPTLPTTGPDVARRGELGMAAHPRARRSALDIGTFASLSALHG
jgi:hypothetical protein